MVINSRHSQSIQILKHHFVHNIHRFYLLIKYKTEKTVEKFTSLHLGIHINEVSESLFFRSPYKNEECFSHYPTDRVLF
jgi:hypothetical protein